MLDFYADWCISCKEMEKYAFTHPEVLAALEDVLTLQADVTDNDQDRYRADDFTRDLRATGNFVFRLPMARKYDTVV